MKKIKLLLDLDGVLITSPPWRPDEIDIDGYSVFNSKCVKNLNKLLDFADFEIWLSSARRKFKSIEEFNKIFQFRGINQNIVGYLPINNDYIKRCVEIEHFIKNPGIEPYLVIDDDKSLIDFSHKDHLVLTQHLIGFNHEMLEEAKSKIITEQ